MRFKDYYNQEDLAISFELFPPKTEKAEKDLEANLPRLIELNPDFFTVTYGALGTTRDGTLKLASKLKMEYNVEVAHHLTCVALNKDQLDKALEEIKSKGINKIVAIRGDIPQGESEFKPPVGGYSHANEMVSHIKEFDDQFSIAVAGYPEKHIEASDFDFDIRNLKRKVEAGAEIVITQLFYDNNDFYRFQDRCQKIGIDVPIIAGLMPILSANQIVRISSMCGAKIPHSLMQKLDKAGNNLQLVQKIGIEHAIKQANELFEQGVHGIHFYVLNQRFHIAEIMESLR